MSKSYRKRGGSPASDRVMSFLKSNDQNSNLVGGSPASNRVMSFLKPNNHNQNLNMVGGSPASSRVMNLLPSSCNAPKDFTLPPVSSDTSGLNLYETTGGGIMGLSRRKHKPVSFKKSRSRKNRGPGCGTSKRRGPGCGTKRRSKRKVGGAIRMPSEFFGTDSGRYGADPNLGRTPHAYGYTFPQSHGVNLPGNFMGPNLGAAPDSSGVQTGGRRTKKYGGNHTSAAPAVAEVVASVASPVATQRALPDNVTVVGGNRKNKKNKRNKKNKKGGAIRMPSEFFGVDSGRYGADPNLGRTPHAYGYTFPQSHGVNLPGNFFGPNLGAAPDSSGVQTGGCGQCGVF